MISESLSSVPLFDLAKLQLLEKSKEEFANQRKVIITGLPENVDIEDLKNNLFQGFEVADVVQDDDKHTATVVLASSMQATKAVEMLNGCSYHSYTLAVSPAPPVSLLFIGNLPFEFTEDQFKDLMSPFGPIDRIFLVRSEVTGESKGYGFVEYRSKECAAQSKQQLINTGSKYVGGRILRVAFAEANLNNYADLHSRTLFVDRLPRDFTDGNTLKQLFGKTGAVTFTQVAINQSGVSRGFAFVDYATSEEAEIGQRTHNGTLLEGSNIRVAYGSPGRSGASILGSQPINPLVGNFPTAMQATASGQARPQAWPATAAGPRPLMGARPFMSLDDPRGQFMPPDDPRGPMPLMRHPVAGDPRMILRAMFRGANPHMGLMGPRPFMRGLSHRGRRPLLGEHRFRGRGRGLGHRFHHRGLCARMGIPRPLLEHHQSTDAGHPMHQQVPAPGQESGVVMQPSPVQPQPGQQQHPQQDPQALPSLMQPLQHLQQQQLGPQPLLPGLSGNQTQMMVPQQPSMPGQSGQPLVAPPQVLQVSGIGAVPGQGQLTNGQHIPGHTQSAAIPTAAVQPLMGQAMTGHQGNQFAGAVHDQLVGVHQNQVQSLFGTQPYPVQASAANGVTGPPNRVQSNPYVTGHAPGHAPVMQTQPSTMQYQPMATPQSMPPQAVSIAGQVSAAQSDPTQQYHHYGMPHQPLTEQGIEQPGYAVPTQELGQGMQQIPQPLMQLQPVVAAQPVMPPQQPGNPSLVPSQQVHPLMQAQQPQSLLQTQQVHPHMQISQVQPMVQQAPTQVQPLMQAQSAQQLAQQQLAAYYVQQEITAQQQTSQAFQQMAGQPTSINVSGQNQWPPQAVSAVSQMSSIAGSHSQASAVVASQWQQQQTTPLMTQPVPLMATQPMSLLTQSTGHTQQPAYGQYRQALPEANYYSPLRQHQPGVNEPAFSGQNATAYSPAYSMTYSQSQGSIPSLMTASPSLVPQHSAAPVMYNTQNPADNHSVAKRALEHPGEQPFMGHAPMGGMGYYDNKRPRY